MIVKFYSEKLKRWFYDIRSGQRGDAEKHFTLTMMENFRKFLEDCQKEGENPIESCEKAIEGIEKSYEVKEVSNPYKELK